MKLSKLILTVILLISIRSTAQTNNDNHPTISTVKVKYKSAPAGTPGNGVEMSVIMEATINLKVTSGISKVFVKVKDNFSNSVVYEVNYNINSSAISNNQGYKLFENNSGEIFISNGIVMALKPYIYEVYTQDSQANPSVVFSSIQ